MRYLFQGYRRLLSHPRYGIWVLLGSLLYLISPIDISPDLIPLLGQIDDVALIVLMVTAASQWLSQQFLAAEENNATSQEDDSVRETVDVKAVEVDG
ncbi:MAG: YkvA family protein [Leptolyngbyaceae cyanobacterium]